VPTSYGATLPNGGQRAAHPTKDLSDSQKSGNLRAPFSLQ
jgi:hypothetical protein